MNIIIPGQPITKHRPRFSRHGTHVVTYSDQSDDSERIKQIIRNQIAVESIIFGSVFVSMVFHIGRPKSHYRTGKYAGLLKPAAPNEHIVKPDLDNYVKWILDVLNGIAWEDDSQVIKIDAMKGYCYNIADAKTIIMVES